MFPEDEFVFPNYGTETGAGNTIANVPATMAAMLGVPFSGLPPLAPELWEPLVANGRPKRIVQIIIDALGQNLVEQESETFAGIREKAAVMGEITSVFPSTTVNCLSCFWTGVAPAQHGLVSLRLLFPELGVVGQMIHWTPNFYKAKDALVEGGLDPETFLAAPGMAEQFAAAGVPVYAFKGYDIVDSALSKMHGRGCEEQIGAFSFTDMMHQMVGLLEEKAGEPLIASAYWPTIDTMSHFRGPDSDAVARELEALIHQIEKHFLDALSPEAREDTVVMIVADHGQLRFEEEDVAQMEDHPAIIDNLMIMGTGEPRTPYLYARQGEMDTVLDYINEELGEFGTAVSASYALEQGWLGPEPYAHETRSRLGDIVVMMRPKKLLVAPTDNTIVKRMVGKHGGLSPDEMRVPFIGLRL